jgi:hypothetical protein
MGEACLPAHLQFHIFFYRSFLFFAISFPIPLTSFFTLFSFPLFSLFFHLPLPTFTPSPLHFTCSPCPYTHTQPSTLPLLASSPCTYTPTRCPRQEKKKSKLAALEHRLLRKKKAQPFHNNTNLLFWLFSRRWHLSRET